MKIIAGAKPKFTPQLRRAESLAKPGGVAALDSSRNDAPALLTGAQKIRRERWKRRSESAKFLTPLAVETNGNMRPVRPGRCGWTLGTSVGLMNDKTRPAGFAGLERCGSIWACPCCSAVIRAGRAIEIETAVQRHQATGGSVVFFTGTQRHHRGDELAHTLDVILSAWSRTLRNKGWRLLKKNFEISGYIRAVEVTGNFDNDGHGWHPHLHSLIFIDRELSSDELDALRGKLFAEWTRAVVAVGGKAPTEKGLDMQKVDKDGKVLAQYLGKIQDDKEAKKWSAGAEAARFDAKQGHSEGAIMPFELLDENSPLPEQLRANLWREYYTASKGRRAITWSRGLKDRYEVEEKADEEILEEQDSTTLVWRTSAESYRRLRAEGGELPALALELAEAEKWEELAKLLPPDDAWLRDRKKTRLIE